MLKKHYWEGLVELLLWIIKKFFRFWLLNVVVCHQKKSVEKYYFHRNLEQLQKSKDLKDVRFKCYLNCFKEYIELWLMSRITRLLKSIVGNHTKNCKKARTLKMWGSNAIWIALKNTSKITRLVKSIIANKQKLKN